MSTLKTRPVETRGEGTGRRSRARGMRAASAVCCALGSSLLILSCAGSATEEQEARAPTAEDASGQAAHGHPAGKDRADAGLRERTAGEKANLAEFLAIAEKLEQSDALLMGGAQVHVLRRRLEQVTQGAPEEMNLRSLYGRELLRLGDNAEALRQFQLALRVKHAFEGEGAPAPLEVPEVLLERQASVISENWAG